MWINITKDIFDNSDFKALNYLYQILTHSSFNSRPRYNIVIDTEKVKHTNNFKRLLSIEKNLTEFLDLEYSYYHTSGKSTSYKISSKKNGLNFNVEEAIMFFNQPVSIILENNKNDAEFIFAIIKHWGAKDGYNKAQEHVDNAWLQFENAGGCSNIPNFLEGFLRQFKSLALRNNKSIFTYFRGIIIIDSDKEFASQAIKKSHESLLNKIKKLGLNTDGIIDQDSGEIINQNVNVHILEKRMMENYMPKSVFQEIFRQLNHQNEQELKDWLSAYLNLNSAEELDFINIPDGKLHGILTPIPSELQTLWNAVSLVNLERLNKGFNFKGFSENGNHNIGKEYNLKNELPKWFKKELVTRENLEERDGKGELKRILDKMVNLL